MKTIWNNEELEYLKKAYKSTPAKEILQNIHRTWDSILCKAKRLGLNREIKEMPSKISSAEYTQLKVNDYQIFKDYAVIYIDSSKYGRLECLIDIQNLNELIKRRWFAAYNNTSKSFYAYSKISVNKKRVTLQMHRIITNCPKGLVVDHINHNTLDNRLKNLRICTDAQNKQNQISTIATSKTSKFRGVSYDSKMGKYRAYCSHNGNKIHIGIFETEAEANEVVKAARKKYMPFAL